MDCFNKKILEFMYNLTLNERYMNSLEMSRNISIGSKKITDRTIRRWLHFLKQNKYFNYYSNIIDEEFGLTNVMVSVNDVKNEKIANQLPYKTSILAGKDMRGFENSLLLFYSIPEASFNAFQDSWKNALNSGQIGNFQINRYRTETAFYSPFHEVVGDDGFIRISNGREIDNSYFKELLYNNMRRKISVKINKEIERNPFIIPLVCELHEDSHLSSTLLWSIVKDKMKSGLWSFIRDSRVRRKKKDGLGVKFVQRTMRHLNDNFNDFFQQIRLGYKPFYRNNISLYLTLKFKNRNNIIDFSDSVSKNSLSTIVYPPLKNKNLLTGFHITTNSKNALKIIHDICPRYVNSCSNNKAVWIDSDKSFELQKNNNMKIDYKNLFNPKSVSWNCSFN